jgi:hypothetical protein
MNFFYKSQIGSSMLQVMVASAVLLGAGLVVTKTMRGQESLHKSSTLRSATFNEVGEISEVLTDWETCLATLSQNGPLTKDAAFDSIRNSSGASVYTVGGDITSGKIVELNLEGYVASTGLRYTQARLRVNMQFKEKRGGAQNSVGGTQKSFKIPIYLITNDNVVQTCMSDSANVVHEALTEACRQFGGTMNNATGSCEGIGGTTGLVKKFVDDYFCSSTGTGCPHPYAGQTCPDTYGKGNFAVNNFDGPGNMNCICMPVKCAEPANYCLGKDLGSDWCGTTCPKGSWDPVDYVPDPSTVCNGQSFTQTNSCGESRLATGTKTCP